MAKFESGDYVYIPRVKIGLESGYSSFYRTKVVDVKAGSIRVDLPEGKTSEWVSTSFAKKIIKALVVAVGDFDSELGLIDPLYKTVLHHFRLLLSDDEALGVKVRSLTEFSSYWNKEESEVSHVVFIGHGRSDAIYFGVDGWVESTQFRHAIESPGVSKKHFVFLCCQTGKANFSKHLSSSKACEDVVAPFHSAHGAVASQFCQTYFLLMYLGGYTSKVAFNKAKKAGVHSTKFRFWDDGKLAKTST